MEDQSNTADDGSGPFNRFDFAFNNWSLHNRFIYTEVVLNLNFTKLNHVFEPSLGCKHYQVQLFAPDCSRVLSLELGRSHFLRIETKSPVQYLIADNSISNCGSYRSAYLMIIHLHNLTRLLLNAQPPVCGQCHNVPLLQVESGQLPALITLLHSTSCRL